jgi:hypothetical protein
MFIHVYNKEKKNVSAVIKYQCYFLTVSNLITQRNIYIFFFLE